ncbi:transporter substrate-binding domain-containing protein [Pseudoflavonifractor phocaeensis]|uniref:transporter substrate-binding domain-containing protein n=1 Tax=Pseudoflavonifractor phocaeensis TaxID=1870988 RepID=UPI0019583464|nr:transporter substrate-binding domain-containing protein [Pseudoflavonifractor phocaeensis]MBM6927231.1 transporter substrate-binding domain-containing protein [Pseudoflavonifractor phocaeensis]
MKRKLLSLVSAVSLSLCLAACSGGSGTGTASSPASTDTASPALSVAAQEETSSGDVKLVESGTLKVAMECAYAPFNWTQADDSNGAVPISGTSDYAYGYDVMFAKEIAQELGCELEIVKMEWDALIPALQSGTVDAVIAGQCITADRAAQVDFSDPYYYASIVCLVKSDSPYASATGIDGFEGATATSQLGTVWYDTCLPQVPGIELLPAQESVPAMLVALDSGAVDLVVTDQPTALSACKAYPDMVMLDFSGTEGDFDVSEEETNFGISVQKGNTGLTEAINQVLSRYTTDDYTAMMDEAISVQPLNND